jgi:hypothetical protein
VHLNAARTVLGREPDDELDAVDVVLREREDEPERNRRPANDLEVGDRAGERSGPAADRVVLRRLPSIEIATTSRNGVRGAQRAAVASIPFDVIVVTIPRARACARSSASGRYSSGSPPDTASCRYPSSAASSRQVARSSGGSSSRTVGPDDE